MVSGNREAPIHSKYVLIVDSDPRVLQKVAGGLAQHGFDVQVAPDVNSARASIGRQKPDLAIIDLTPPDISGFELLQYVKDDPRSSHVPVLVVMECAGDQDKVRAFDAGADDFVAKPFSMQELLARVRALLRRVYRNDVNGQMCACGFVLDAVSHRVTFNGQPITLAPLQFRLMSILMANAERALSRAFIVSRVWETPSQTDIRSVDGLVRKLRQLLKGFGCDTCIKPYQAWAIDSLRTDRSRCR